MSIKLVILIIFIVPIASMTRLLKNKRISDEYIGRGTEDDGFIPVKDKVSGPVDVLDHMACFIFCIFFFVILINLLKKLTKRTVILLCP